MTDFSLIDAADLERKRIKESSACWKCGSPDPFVLRIDGCSDCDGRPFCPSCHRYTDLPKATHNPCTSC